jgi:hypothetical protein
MRHIVLLLAAGIAGLLSGILPSLSAPPRMGGHWDVTTCDDPNRTNCLTGCYTFTVVPGHVAKSPTSGRVTQNDVPAFPFSGRWIQLGDRVSFWGVTQFGDSDEFFPVAFFDGTFLSATELNGESFVSLIIQAEGPIGNATTGAWHAVKRGTACP